MYVVLSDTAVVLIVCTGENQENERRSSERTSETGGRQNSIVFNLVAK